MYHLQHNYLIFLGVIENFTVRGKGIMQRMNASEGSGQAFRPLGRSGDGAHYFVD